MKKCLPIVLLALSANLAFAQQGTATKKMTHDKEHHHEGPADHEHEEAHHQKHDHLKHHPDHNPSKEVGEDEHLKKTTKKNK